MFCDKYSIYFILCVVLSVSRCILNVMTNTFTKTISQIEFKFKPGDSQGDVVACWGREQRKKKNEHQDCK